MTSGTQEPPTGDDDLTPESTRRLRRTGERRARIGGRSERVVRSVLEAAVAEIARVGYGALRIDDVATRAGVNKTTVYRRWPTKPELVTAALRTIVDRPETPDTGTLRGDLIVLLRRFVIKACRTDGQTMMRMFSLEKHHPEVAEIARTLRAEHLAPWEEVVSRAVRRGEIPEGSDLKLILDTLSGTVFSKLNRGLDEVDDTYLFAVIDLVLAGVRSGGAIRRAPS
jgi:AcrR family transcriptional regulator